MIFIIIKWEFFALQMIIITLINVVIFY